MTASYRSARGELVDFSILRIKEELQAGGSTVVDKARRTRRIGKRRKLSDKLQATSTQDVAKQEDHVVQVTDETVDTLSTTDEHKVVRKRTQK